MRTLLLAALLLHTAVAQADGLDDAWRGTAWGEPPEALQHHFGASAVALPRPIDFGDSYAPLVLRGVPVGGVTLIAYYQIDKATHGLKRIQLERPRHAVNAGAFRAVLAALTTAYGEPDATCGTGPEPATGYQGGSEYVWRRDSAIIRAIFRDTTFAAFDSCFSPPCGLTAQLLVRVSPAAEDRSACPPLPAGAKPRRPRD
jgi:hypothetical protein